jgi:hypothetical protein
MINIDFWIQIEEEEEEQEEQEGQILHQHQNLNKMNKRMLMRTEYFCKYHL